MLNEVMSLPVGHQVECSLPDPNENVTSIETTVKYQKYLAHVIKVTIANDGHLYHT